MKRNSACRAIAGTLNRMRLWARDTRGNVTIIFGLAIIPLMIGMGMAVDLTNQVRVQQRLSRLADAAALAAARADGDEAARQAVAQRFLIANAINDLGQGVTISNVTVTYDPETRRVEVNATADVETTLMQLAGIDHTTARAHSVTGLEVAAGKSVSLTLVLDVSGSMGWNDKIGTLRVAATDLLDTVHANDDDDEFVRTGLVTYSSSIRQTVSMDWGIDHTRSVVQGLTASGGTASTSAVSVAGGWLGGNSEYAHHAQQDVHDGDDFELVRFMIFMTDGDNNNRSDDRNTKRKCDQIKDNGVEIYSVAFEAPSRGQELLEYCATDSEHYFDADGAEAFTSAFEEIAQRIQSSMLRIVE